MMPQRINRTLFLVLLAVIFAFGRGHAAGEIVHMGLSTVGLYELPSEIAKRRGFYAEEGLEVRKVAVRTGLHPAALLAGELDYSTVPGLVMRASLQGLPLKTVMGWFDRPLHMLIGRPNIKKVTDLKGKKIAISSIGSTPHVMVREALLRSGMNPDRDAVFLAIGGSGERLVALASGAVDATPLDVAYLEKTEKLGFPNVLFLGDVIGLRLGGLAVTTEKIQRNPGQITRVIRASLKGIRFLKNNKPGTLAIMRDYLHLSEEYVDKIHQFAVKSLNEDGLVAKSSFDTEMRLMKEQLRIKEDVPEEKIADWRFIKEILAKP